MTLASLIGPGRRAVVVGAGKSGLSAARLLATTGAAVVLCDEKPVAAAAPAGVELRPSASPLPLDGAALVVVSPGVPLGHPQLAGFRARHPAVPMFGEVELAFRAEPAPRLAAITGTNGKSTTTALCGEMVKAEGLRTFVGGNLGTPLCEAVGKGFEAHVVELSSFQLEGVEAFHAKSAAVLNVTPDHLDRYPSLQAYADAKARIFRHQTAADSAVLNPDDPWYGRLAAATTGRRRTFGRSGDARPTPTGFTVDGRPFLLANRALRGEHNRANAMAAALVALGLGVGPDAIQRGLDSFPGLPHRLELVRELSGAEWINDSKATNVDSTVVALKAIPGSLIWIAGGRGKGAPYAPLGSLLGSRLKRALYIGEDSSELARQLSQYANQSEQVGSLEVAVRRARALAVAGDTVLLSPACASYDQFNNYEHRGERFRELVAAL